MVFCVGIIFWSLYARYGHTRSPAKPDSFINVKVANCFEKEVIEIINTDNKE